MLIRPSFVAPPTLGYVRPQFSADSNPTPDFVLDKFSGLAMFIMGKPQVINEILLDELVAVFGDKNVLPEQGYTHDPVKEPIERAVQYGESVFKLSWSPRTEEDRSEATRILTVIHPQGSPYLGKRRPRHFSVTIQRLDNGTYQISDVRSVDSPTTVQHFTVKDNLL